MTIQAIFLVALCVTLDSVAHLFFRMAGKYPQHYVRYVAPAVCFYGAWAAAWFQVLRIVPVGKATPLMGASYVVTALLSKILFHENVNARRWLGIFVIVIGVGLLAGEAP